MHVFQYFAVMQVVWAVKHRHIGDAFFDLDAAAFLCTHLPQASTAAQSFQAQTLAAQHSAAETPVAQGSHAGLPRPQKKKTAPLQHHAGHLLHDSGPTQVITCQESPSHALQQPNCAAPTVQSTIVKDPAPQSSAAQDSLNQQRPAAQALPASDSPIVNSAVDQVDLPAQNSYDECSTSAQDSGLNAQRQLPQRTRQQRRGKHRHRHTDTEYVPSPVGSKDQPDLCHAETRLEPVVKAQQVCDLFTTLNLLRSYS